MEGQARQKTLKVSPSDENTQQKLQGLHTHPVCPKTQVPGQSGPTVYRSAPIHPNVQNPVVAYSCRLPSGTRSHLPPVYNNPWAINTFGALPQQQGMMPFSVLPMTGPFSMEAMVGMSRMFNVQFRPHSFVQGASSPSVPAAHNFPYTIEKHRFPTFVTQDGETVGLATPPQVSSRIATCNRQCVPPSASCGAQSISKLEQNGNCKYMTSENPLRNENVPHFEKEGQKIDTTNLENSLQLSVQQSSGGTSAMFGMNEAVAKSQGNVHLPVATGLTPSVSAPFQSLLSAAMSTYTVLSTVATTSTPSSHSIYPHCSVTKPMPTATALDKTAVEDDQSKKSNDKKTSRSDIDYKECKSLDSNEDGENIDVEFDEINPSSPDSLPPDIIADWNKLDACKGHDQSVGSNSSNEEGRPLSFVPGQGAEDQTVQETADHASTMSHENKVTSWTKHSIVPSRSEGKRTSSVAKKDRVFDVRSEENVLDTSRHVKSLRNYGSGISGETPPQNSVEFKHSDKVKKRKKISPIFRQCQKRSRLKTAKAFPSPLRTGDNFIPETLRKRTRKFSFVGTKKVDPENGSRSAKQLSEIAQGGAKRQHQTNEMTAGNSNRSCFHSTDDVSRSQAEEPLPIKVCQNTLTNSELDQRNEENPVLSKQQSNNSKHLTTKLTSVNSENSVPGHQPVPRIQVQLLEPFCKTGCSRSDAPDVTDVISSEHQVSNTELLRDASPPNIAAQEQLPDSSRSVLQNLKTAEDLASRESIDDDSAKASDSLNMAIVETMDSINMSNANVDKVSKLLKEQCDVREDFISGLLTVLEIGYRVNLNMADSLHLLQSHRLYQKEDQNLSRENSNTSLPQLAQECPLDLRTNRPSGDLEINKATGTLCLPGDEERVPARANSNCKAQRLQETGQSTPVIQPCVVSLCRLSGLKGATLENSSLTPKSCCVGRRGTRQVSGTASGKALSGSIVVSSPPSSTSALTSGNKGYQVSVTTAERVDPPVASNSIQTKQDSSLTNSSEETADGGLVSDLLCTEIYSVSSKDANRKIEKHSVKADTSIRYDSGGVETAESGPNSTLRVAPRPVKRKPVIRKKRGRHCRNKLGESTAHQSSPEHSVVSWAPGATEGTDVLLNPEDNVLQLDDDMTLGLDNHDTDKLRIPNSQSAQESLGQLSTTSITSATDSASIFQRDLDQVYGVRYSNLSPDESSSTDVSSTSEHSPEIDADTDARSSVVKLRRKAATWQRCAGNTAGNSGVVVNSPALERSKSVVYKRKLATGDWGLPQSQHQPICSTGGPRIDPSDDNTGNIIPKNHEGVCEPASTQPETAKKETVGRKRLGRPPRSKYKEVLPSLAHMRIKNLLYRKKSKSKVADSSGSESEQTDKAKNMSSENQTGDSTSEEVIHPRRRRGLTDGQRQCCFKVFDLVYNFGWSEPFRDEIKPQQVPDYFTVVKKPMYFQLVASKLRQGEYACVKEFVSDMRLVFHNCRLYHQPHPLQISDKLLGAARNVEKYMDELLRKHFPDLDLSGVTGSTNKTRSRHCAAKDEAKS